MIWLAFAAPVVGYLIGSISFAVIFTKLFARTDVRKYGSGNAGATNVMRVAGFLPGILTFICDGLKGALAAFVGKWAYGMAFGADSKWALVGAYLCAVVCMLGHAFPLFFNFAGGKCAATSVGIFLVCCPLAVVVGLAGFTINMLATRIVSLSTLVATVMVVGISVGVNGFAAHGFDWCIVLLSFIAGVIVFIRHRENIARLKNGTEKQLMVKKKS